VLQTTFGDYVDCGLLVMDRMSGSFLMDPFRFLHSSDLHLGRAFGNFPEGIRHRLREARHGAITRLAAAARSGGAATILLAGDTFDAETPAPDTLRQALTAMREAPDLTWVILPGNHDSLAATELWRRIATDSPANLRAQSSDAPVELSAGVWLLPAPCTQRRPGRDLTEAMSAPTPEGERRIGLGHGAITDFSGEEGTTGIIPPDRAQRSGLDYLALGDWHGQLQVNPPTWYSGTPEPDGFKHEAPGSALLVELDGAAPKVTPVAVGGFRWLRPQIELLPGEDAVARVANVLPRTGARDHLVRVTVTGRLPLAERAALDADLAHRAPDFGWFSQDLTRLAVDAMPADLDLIDRGGALRQAAETLLAEAGDVSLSQADRETAASALAKLYAFTQEVRA
jgi:DNA repair exonuclease SbcCD nuclease subunit